MNNLTSTIPEKIEEKNQIADLGSDMRSSPDTVTVGILGSVLVFHCSGLCGCRPPLLFPAIVIGSFLFLNKFRKHFVSLRKSPGCWLSKACQGDGGLS